MGILSLRKTFIVVFYVPKVGGDASYKFEQVLCCGSDGILAFSVADPMESWPFLLRIREQKRNVFLTRPCLTDVE